MKILTKKDIIQTRPFTLEELEIKFHDDAETQIYHRLKSVDWVNVLPITSDGQAVLINQPRVGSNSVILECPGGMVDPGEKDPTITAIRELEEETGFTTQRILPLASLFANPAIMNNKCHFFLALNCQPVTTRTNFPDSDEVISVAFTPVSELEGLVRTGQMNHSLSALCVMLAQKYLPGIR